MILLNEETCEIDGKAFDGTTPLMAASANIPKSKQCIKVLCQFKADPRATNDEGVTALHIAIDRRPDLKVVKWLVRSGAQVDDANNDPMMYLFTARLLANENKCRIRVELPAYADEEEGGEYLETEDAEVTEIAKYLAKHGYVKIALRAVLHFTGGMNRFLLYPMEVKLLDEVVECFLENGADFKRNLTLDESFIYGAHPLCLFAQKSIIFLEGVPTSFVFESGSIRIQMFNAITVLLFQGLVTGTVPLTVVKEIQDELELTIEHLPTEFLPLETLYDMTHNPPSLSQLARTTIRRQVAECGKLDRKNLKKLPLPEALKDFVQLADLGDGSKVEEIMGEAARVFHITNVLETEDVDDMMPTTDDDMEI